MRQYVDEKGNIIQEPDLIDILKGKDPQLGKKAEDTINKIGLLKSYQRFLYQFPNGSEMNLIQGRGKDWEDFINFIDGQEGLPELIPMLEDLSDGRRDLRGDKVVVVRSDRPFYDTLDISKTAKPLPDAKAEGWIGTLESKCITDLPDSELYSLDGKVHRRIILNKAVPLTKKQLASFAIGSIIYYDNHHFDEAITQVLEEFKKLPLGNKKVIIYDKYPNVDYAVLKHKLKGDEKEIAHIKDTLWTDFAPFYGKRQIPNSHLCTTVEYLKDKPWQLVLKAEDSRDIGEIYEEVMANIGKDILQITNKNNEIWIYIAKNLKDNFSKEQWEKIRKAPLGDQDKWFKKFTDEEGFSLTSTTYIAMRVHNDRTLSEPNTELLIGKLEKALSPFNYQRHKTSISMGIMDCPQNSHLMEMTNCCYTENSRLFSGEVMVYKK
ncbi:MAG: hypothetical protein PHH54_05965 [Candidatus Nanoarchaeia archaeon]|nr:hypothetical protein [Candidatus Nanoarchaeia archaeon]MDD5741500.1 hypothetical protein [Candidatus Nanoarchaeia archaeon]